MSAQSSVLIPCPACQNLVSPQATACPKCGHPISRAEPQMETANPRASGSVMFQVFAALCLFVALGSFIAGFGHLQMGQSNYNKERDEMRRNSGLSSGDPLVWKTERELAAIADREEISHGYTSLAFGGVLIIPAVVLWRRGARRKR